MSLKLQSTLYVRDPVTGALREATRSDAAAAGYAPTALLRLLLATLHLTSYRLSLEHYSIDEAVSHVEKALKENETP